MDFSFLNIDKYKEQIEETEYIHNDLSNLRKQIILDMNKNNNHLYNYVLFKNIISNDLCDFIINESEKYALKNKTELNKDGWIRTRHKNYPTTDLPIRNIESLSILLNNIISYNIFPLIEKSFNVNKYFLGCNDIFIVRYKDIEQNKLARHKDGCAFSFNILLNDSSNFEGGGTIINENNEDILVKNEKGGLLLHSGQVFHSGNIITKGIRYILVGFISYLKGYNNKIINFNKEIDSNCNLESWNIQMDNNYYDNINEFINIDLKERDTFLLDTFKDKFNLLEKIIYDLSIFHLKRLNLNIDFNRYKIEFWWKNEYIKSNIKIIHGLHSDKDEKLMHSNNILMTPLLSTVTYINDSIYPTLLTSTPEILFNKNDQINLKKGIILSFPKKLKHICFNGSNFHGVYNIYEGSNDKIEQSNRKTLMFNIWDSHSPLETKINNNCNENYIFEKNQEIINLIEINKEKYLKIKLEELEMKELLQLVLSKSILVPYKFKKFLNNFNSNDIIEFDI